MHTSNSPIFIVGTERSGSNLLRLILNAHSRISVPHPPHIMRYFSPLSPYYEPLAQARNIRRLVEDVLRLVRLHIFPWSTVPSVDFVLKTLRRRELFDVCVAIYEWHARFEGKPRWGCKSTFMIDHVETIATRIPSAKLIWLIRDPRDVAASSIDSVFGPCTPLLTARLWSRQQCEGIERGSAYESKNWLRVRYEDLASDPERITDKICNFVGEAFEPAMLDFFTTRQARLGASLSRSWRLTAAPIQSTSVGSYRWRLKSTQVADVEKTTDSLMSAFGYERADCLHTQDYRLLNGLALLLCEGGHRVRVELISMIGDRNHWRRWRRFAFLMWLRTNARLSQILQSFRRRIAATIGFEI